MIGSKYLGLTRISISKSEAIGDFGFVFEI